VILTVKELAEYLKMNRRILQRKACNGEIPAFKLGRQYRFDKELIDKWLSQKTATNTLHILVVDDDPIIRRLFIRSLGGNGNQITTIDNGFEALELVARKRFDLIFLDLLMPVIDGGELFARIRDIDKHVTMTIMTNEVDTKLLKRALKKGPVLLMHKPLDSCDVLEALGSFTQNLRAR
jgi:two-component system, sensor histidine kinase